MENSIYEYEIKLLGDSEELSKVADNLLEVSRFRNPPDEYVFETQYFDTDDGLFANAGYSLRYRAQQGRFPPCMEIKQLEGSENGMSKRLEIGVRKDAGILSLYFSLLANPNFPKDVGALPQFIDLKEIYATVVSRKEQEVVVVIDDVPYIIELALDNIKFMKNNSVLSQESELEFEIKSGGFSSEHLMAWFKENVVKDANVEFTLDSKAKRLQKLVDKKLEFA